MRKKRTNLSLAGIIVINFLLISTHCYIFAASNTQDDGAAAATYSAGWSVRQDSNCYGGSYHYCEQTGKTVDITFNGPAIVLYSTRTSAAGSFDISIDGQHDATIHTKNYYSVTDYQCPVYQKNNLSSGSHTLRLTTKSADGVVVDAFKVGDDIPFVPQKVMMPTLPVGSIKVDGWIKKHIQEDMDRGWATNKAWQDGYPNEEYYYPFIVKEKSRWGGEYPSHWISAVARFGWLGDSASYKATATKAVDDILDTLDNDDAYIGCLPMDLRWTKGYNGFFNMWSYGEGFNALMEYCEYTNRQDVATAVKNAFDLMESHAEEMYDGHSYEISCANAATYLYKAFNDEHYLQRAQYWLKRYLKGYTSSPNAGEITLDIHSAGSGILQSALVDYFEQTFDVAAYYNILRSNDYLFNNRQHVHGGATVGGSFFNGAEWFRTLHPYAASEACSLYYWAYLWVRMLSLSGETQWADHAETIMFNAVPTHRSKDGRCAAYLARMNETDALEKGSWGDAELYKKDTYTACCPSCLLRTYPLLNKYSVLRTQDNGLSVAFYGPGTTVATVDGVNVTITQNTEYPFKDTINMTVSAGSNKAFPLYLRMPGWCDNPSVNVNGSAISGLTKGQWAVINRTWDSSDTVSIQFPMKTTVHYWEDKAAAVQHGPLVYALSLAYTKKNVDIHGAFDPVLDNGITYVDDRDGSITYSNGFEEYSTGVTATNKAGEHFEYTFTGTEITWLSHRWVDQGEADIYIDGQKETTVKLSYESMDQEKVKIYIDGKKDETVQPYSQPEREWNAPVYTKTGLSSGEHTIKIVTKNTDWVCNDGFMIKSSQPNPLSTWNYCLMLDNNDPASSFTFMTKSVPADGYAWEHPPVALQVKAKKVKNWTDGNTALPDSPLDLEDAEKTIELVPIGFSALRMTYLPYVKN